MSIESVTETGIPRRFAASGTIAGSGKLLGFFCSATGGTIAVSTKDGTTAAATVILASAFTPTVGQFHLLPFNYYGDVTITITGTIDVTFAHTRG